MTHSDIEIAEALIDERKALIGYLLDRAEQYTPSLTSIFEDLAYDIVALRHVECHEAGEYEALRDRVDQIFRTGRRSRRV